MVWFKQRYPEHAKSARSNQLGRYYGRQSNLESHLLGDKLANKLVKQKCYMGIPRNANDVAFGPVEASE